MSVEAKPLSITAAPDQQFVKPMARYPLMPVIYILLAVYIDGELLICKPQYTWPGLIIVLLGVPVYFLWSKVEPPDFVPVGLAGGYAVGPGTT